MLVVYGVTDCVPGFLACIRRCPSITGGEVEGGRWEREEQAREVSGVQMF
jgi:hypothetical protein